MADTEQATPGFSGGGNHPEAHLPVINEDGTVEFNSRDTVFGISVIESNCARSWLLWDRAVHALDKNILLTC